MIVNSAPENTAFLSNVGNVGEFRIRNSAKAFSILSSGLYSNKIRAIVRELSCNAHDSHVAAGCAERSFDVHLPSDIEPWFSVRDYGVGLDAEQVTTLYTTYFESTKTTSNEFIGALGLGSKSPFSYTDNFTVTAIKHGRKGIYSAFINAEGVPSIALMLAEDTAEPTGVEVKFSVNSRSDFHKFRQEAVEVFRWFPQQPVISGISDFAIPEQRYLDRDIVPGVHYTNHSSLAIMGNISYPIQVPNAESNLGGLADILRCGLEMHFGIGELDIQASREGLSYVPETIAAIRQRLQQVQDALASKLQVAADAIENLWDRAEFLEQKRHQALWTCAVANYVARTQFPLMSGKGPYAHLTTLSLDVAELAEKYNIVLHVFGVTGTGALVQRRPGELARTAADGISYLKPAHVFRADPQLMFVINDGKTGAQERVRHHWRSKMLRQDLVLITAADRTQPMQTDAFFASIHNPNKRMLVSELLLKPRKQRENLNKITVLTLVADRRSADPVWKDSVGSIADLDPKQPRYYLPLRGYQVVSKLGDVSAKDIYHWLRDSRVQALNSIEILGVRGADLEQVQKLKNWKNLEEHLSEALPRMQSSIYAGMFLSDKTDTVGVLMRHTVAQNLPSTHAYAVLRAALEQGQGFHRASISSVSRLFQRYVPGSNFAAQSIPTVETLRAQHAALINRYPLLQHLSINTADEKILEYINQLDQLEHCKS
jgi:hypothetical protein